jgi:hypothetical protein
MQDLSNDHDTFIFIVYEQYLSLENRLSTIIIGAQAVMLQIMRYMTLVKVHPKFVQIRKLAGDGICQGTQI